MKAYRHTALLETLHLEQSGIPIYVQIRDQMLRAIGAGLAKPGEKMPTMREVAVALRIDLNTVRRAYDSLAQTGAIVVVPARGTFVADAPPKFNLQDQLKQTDDLAHRVIALARSAGLNPFEVGTRIAEIAKEDKR